MGWQVSDTNTDWQVSVLLLLGLVLGTVSSRARPSLDAIIDMFYRGSAQNTAHFKCHFFVCVRANSGGPIPRRGPFPRQLPYVFNAHSDFSLIR